MGLENLKQEVVGEERRCGQAKAEPDPLANLAIQGCGQIAFEKAQHGSHVKAQI